jgi:hypothetical protein
LPYLVYKNIPNAIGKGLKKSKKWVLILSYENKGAQKINNQSTKFMGLVCMDGSESLTLLQKSAFFFSFFFPG